MFGETEFLGCFNDRNKKRQYSVKCISQEGGHIIQITKEYFLFALMNIIPFR